jgi:protein-S-isoprenylcysteine O-methyltransferase Ste14
MSALAASLLLHFLLPVHRIIFFPFNLTGLIPTVLGIYLNLSADNAFKRVNTTVKPFEESSVLIKNGVFRFTRHPMYLGMGMILLGLAMFLGTLSPYIAVLIFLLLIEKKFIKSEEQMLEMTFGREWLDYKRRVRRWI